MAFDIIEEANKLARGKTIIEVRALPDGRTVVNLHGKTEEIRFAVAAVVSAVLESARKAHPLVSRETIAAIGGADFMASVETATKLFIKGLAADSADPADTKGGMDHDI